MVRWISQPNAVLARRISSSPPQQLAERSDGGMGPADDSVDATCRHVCEDVVLSESHGGGDDRVPGAEEQGSPSRTTFTCN